MTFHDAPDKDYEKELGILGPQLKPLRDRALFDWSFLDDRYMDVEQWKSEVLPRVRKLLTWEERPSDLNPQWGEVIARDTYERRELQFTTQPGVTVPAVILMPKAADQANRVPGLVAMHGMGGFHLWGREKIVHSVCDDHPLIVESREKSYGGQAWADHFARLGYAVIVIDSVLFGERMALPAEELARILPRRHLMHKDEALEIDIRGGAGWQARSLFDFNCRALGKSAAAWIIHDDLCSVDILAGLPEVDGTRIFAAGQSYGGYRTNWLVALSDRIHAGAASSWASTHWHMFGHNLRAVNYFGIIPGLWPHMDLADLTGLAVPKPFLSIVGRDDPMFPHEGMQAFHDRLSGIYAKANTPARFTGEIWPLGHAYTPEMVERSHAFFQES